MKSIFKISVVAIASTLLFSCNNTSKSTKEVSLSNLEDSAMYSIGINIAQNFGDSINTDALVAGIKANATPENMLIKMNELEMVMRKYEKVKMNEMFPAIQEGENFLISKYNEEGVKQAQGGVLYKTIVEGTGKTPTKPTDTIIAHYTGKTVNGKVFDSSVTRGEPFKTALNQVIQGWWIGFSNMKEGGKSELYIPYNLAYGDKQSGADIRPYETLIFEVELIKVIESK